MNITNLLCFEEVSFENYKTKFVNGGISYEPGIDRPGGDYRSFFTNNPSECLNTCLRESNCQAFTHVAAFAQPPTYSNSTGICWLKNHVPNAIPGVSMISGVK